MKSTCKGGAQDENAVEKLGGYYVVMLDTQCSKKQSTFVNHHSSFLEVFLEKV